MKTGKRKTEVQRRVIHIFGAVRLSLLLLAVMHTHLYALDSFLLCKFGTFKLINTSLWERSSFFQFDKKSSHLFQ